VNLLSLHPQWISQDSLERQSQYGVWTYIHICAYTYMSTDIYIYMYAHTHMGKADGEIDFRIGLR